MASDVAQKGAPKGGLSLSPSDYPPVRRGDVVEQLHGQEVADPYRWLEDPDAEETKQFVDAQNALTAKMLERCGTREQFKTLMTQLYDYEKFGAPFKRGDRYYYFYNSGLQAQSVLYSQAGLEAPPAVFLDPNTLSEDGTVALGSFSFSEDGSLLAYSLGSGGSDWRTIHVAQVLEDGSRKELGEQLELVKFSSIAWTHDNKGFFYNRFPSPERAGELGTETDVNVNQQLWYHVVGSLQADDALVLALPEQPEWMIGAEVSDDGRYLLLYVSSGCLPVNRLWYVDLDALPRGAEGALQLPPAESLPLVKLVDDFSAAWDYVANQGSSFTFKTNLDAPRGRLVRCELSDPGPPAAWPDVVPQHESHLLNWARAGRGDALLLCWLRDVASALELRSLSSGAVVADVPLPGIGSVAECTGRRQDSDFFFKFTSFTEPGAIYRFSVTDAQPSPVLYKRVRLSSPGFKPEDFETKQVFVVSKDGTRVPMFITHRRGLALDGSAPALLYGYGGFNISLTPSFSVSRLSWMLAYNGVYAVANLRGGGEYGIGWREAGSVKNKQNVFDDFQAAAEHLHTHGYCSPATTAIEGGSNGGLLVAACANQRPDLYGAVLAHVGVMDMLRFHKFTIGHAWTTDFGDPDNPEHFPYLYAYSPLHNVRLPAQGGYPAMLLTTGDHDDRVVPLHSHKLVATLQHELVAAAGGDTPQTNPLVTRVEVRAGHGAGKPTAKVIAEAADCYAFAAEAMRASWQYAE